MNTERYTIIARDLWIEAENIESAKRPGYTLGNEDVLRNFKAVAERIGVTPEQAWAVYFLKHIDAITAIMAKPELPVSEAPLGRFADAINYLKLGYALLSERSAAAPPTTNDKLTPSSRHASDVTDVFI